LETKKNLLQKSFSANFQITPFGAGVNFMKLFWQKFMEIGEINFLDIVFTAFLCYKNLII